MLGKCLSILSCARKACILMLLWKPIPTVFGIMSGSGMKLCLGYRDDIYVAVAFICKCRLSCFFFVVS